MFPKFSALFRIPVEKKNSVIWKMIITAERGNLQQSVTGRVSECRLVKDLTFRTNTN